jgi:hypothetical protein
MSWWKEKRAESDKHLKDTSHQHQALIIIRAGREVTLSPIHTTLAELQIIWIWGNLNLAIRQNMTIYEVRVIKAGDYQGQVERNFE